MSSILKITKSMESKLHAILAELQEIKDKTHDLEEENCKLRQELAGICRGQGVGNGGPDEMGKTDDNLLNLLALYEQGFHVCNLDFGRRRTAGCLFCMAFLRRAEESQADPNDK